MDPWSQEWLLDTIIPVTDKVLEAQHEFLINR